MSLHVDPSNPTGPISVVTTIMVRCAILLAIVVLAGMVGHVPGGIVSECVVLGPAPGDFGQSLLLAAMGPMGASRSRESRPPAGDRENDAPQHAQLPPITGQFRHTTECLSCLQARTLVAALDRSAIVAITDADGTILYANDNFSRISGYSVEELVGQNHRLLNSGRHDKRFWTDMYRRVASGGVWRGEVCNRTKSGQEYWVDTTITAIVNDKGKVEQFIAIRVDITDRKRAEQDLQAMSSQLSASLESASHLSEELRSKNAVLQEARRSAEAASQAKGDFLANVSHEIRTPITAILGFTELLSGDAGEALHEEQRQDYLATIRRQGQHLLALINEVLDLAKIESGKLVVERKPVDLGQATTEVVDFLRVRANEKALSLRVDVDPDVPQMIMTDPTRLRQILTNLVGNAIKFTERGGIEIGVRMDRAGTHAAEPGMVRISVADSGIGIAPEHQERIFHAFEQADASTTRRFGGTGLGLRICRELADAMGGGISMISHVGAGSVFTLSLPCAAPDESKEPVSETDAARECAGAAMHPLQGLRILLAEDSDDNARLFSHFLTRAGASVVRVKNGYEATLAVTEGGVNGGPLQDPPPYDLIIMDMQMPIMDGYEATELLIRRGCPVPIVAATAHAMEEDRRRCIEIGCRDFITKPVSGDALITAVLRNATRSVRDAA